DPSVEPEHFRLLGEPAGGEDCVERAVAAQQVGGALWTNTARPGQLVGRVTAQRDEIRHLPGIDAIALPHLRGTDARHFAGADRIEDCRSFRSELKGVAVAARD